MTNKFEDKDLSILEVKVKLPQNAYTLNLAEDSKIDVNDLNQGFIEQPTIFAWYAVLAALAKSNVTCLKREIEKQDDYIKKTLIGTLDGKVRKQLEIDGEKITETKVERAIYADPEYIANVEKLSDLKDRLTVAEENSAILDVAKDTMIQRKDMLISLGAQVRSEYDNVPDLKLKGAKENDGEIDKDKVRSILKRKPITT